MRRVAHRRLGGTMRGIPATRADPIDDGRCDGADALLRLLVDERPAVLSDRISASTFRIAASWCRVFCVRRSSGAVAR